MKKNKKLDNPIKQLKFTITRYLIYSVNPQILIDFRNDNKKQFYISILKSKNDALKLITLLREAILELELDIDFLDNIDDRLSREVNNG